MRRSPCPACQRKRARAADEPWGQIYGTRRWRKARGIILARAGRVCERCGSDEGLDVHHRDPLRDGGDPYELANLHALCARCHRGADSRTARKQTA